MSLVKNEKEQVIRKERLELPPGAVIKAEVVDGAIVGGAIKAFLGKVRPHHAKIVTHSSEALIRIAEFPLVRDNTTRVRRALNTTISKFYESRDNKKALKPNEVKKILDNSFSDYFPVNKSEYAFSFKYLGSDSAYSIFMLAALPLRITEGYIKYLRSLNIRLTEIDIIESQLCIPNAENISRRRVETANASTPLSATEEAEEFGGNCIKAFEKCGALEFLFFVDSILCAIYNIYNLNVESLKHELKSFLMFMSAKGNFERIYMPSNISRECLSILCGFFLENGIEIIY